MVAFLTNGGLTKMLTIILTFLLGLGAGIVLFVEVLNGSPINNYVLSIVMAVVGSGVSITGVHVGQSLNTPMVWPNTTSTTTSTTTAQK